MKPNKRMHYKKYISNGDLPELNNHHCICCGVAEQNMEIFVFFGKVNTEDNVYPKRYETITTQLTPSGLKYPQPILTPELVEPYWDRRRQQMFMCAECIYKLSKEISQDTIAKWVLEKL